MPLPDLNFRELIYDLEPFSKQTFFLAVGSNLPCTLVVKPDFRQ